MKLNKEFKKKVNVYIKENLIRGYSFSQIKKAFVIRGYGLDLAEDLIKNYKIKNLIIKSFPLFLILLSVFISLIYKPNIAALLLFDKSYNYTDNLGLTFNEGSTYVWNLENKGPLKSIKLNGEVKDAGAVRVYLKRGNETYLIFDNNRLESQGLEEITGLVAKKEEIQIEIKESLTAEEQIIFDLLIYDINKTKNDLSIDIKKTGNDYSKYVSGNLTYRQEIWVDELISLLNNGNEKVKIKVISEFEVSAANETANQTSASESAINQTINITQPVNEDNATIPLNETLDITLINLTNATIINETIINETKEDITIKDISLILEYKGNSLHDQDNNGVENINSIVDLTVENSRFNWEVEKENLCTRWEVYSVDDEQSTVVCYGSSECCEFIGLQPKRSGWNETFYASYGKDGAALKNIVSSQILHVDYNLSQASPYAEIYYSIWKNLTVEFYEGFTKFEDVCIETCILPEFNDTNYTLIFEVENSSIILDSIGYEVLSLEKINSKPILLKNFSDISFEIGQSYTLNLSEYFYDEEHDTLMFGYYNETSLEVAIANETATLSAANFTGVSYIYFTANDSADLAFSNVFGVEVKEPKYEPRILKSLRRLIGI